MATVNKGLDGPIFFARCIYRHVGRDEIDMRLLKHLEHAVKMIPIDSCPIEIHLSAARPCRDVFERTLLFTPVIENEIEVADGGTSSSAQKVIGLADQRRCSLRNGFQAGIDHLVPIGIGALEEFDLIQAGLEVGRSEGDDDFAYDVVST